MLTNNRFRGFWTICFGIALTMSAWFSMASFAEARGGGRHGGGTHRGGTHRSGGHAGGTHARNRSLAHHSAHRSFARRSAAHNHHHFVHHRGHFGPGFGFDGFDGFDGLDGDVDSVDGVDVASSITLLNPQENRQMIAYTIDSTQDSLALDQSTVYQGGTRVITFDRGGNFGQAQYTLQPGTYRFAASAHGWELFAVALPAE
jgi:hypothetical protein